MDDCTRKDFENLLADWRTRAQRSKIAHYKAAVRFGRRHVLLGVPVVVLIAIVGTAVFATLKELPETWIQTTIGLVSILAAALASLQTFFNYSSRAAKHRTAAANYGSVQREIEEVCCSPLKMPRFYRLQWVESDAGWMSWPRVALTARKTSGERPTQESSNSTQKG